MQALFFVAVLTVIVRSPKCVKISKIYFLFLQASKEHLEKHYADLSKKPFFAGLVSYMASGPVVAMVWEGLNAVKTGDFNAY